MHPYTGCVEAGEPLCDFQAVFLSFLLWLLCRLFLGLSPTSRPHSRANRRQAQLILLECSHLPLELSLTMIDSSSLDLADRKKK